MNDTEMRQVLAAVINTFEGEPIGAVPPDYLPALKAISESRNGWQQTPSGQRTVLSVKDRKDRYNRAMLKLKGVLNAAPRGPDIFQMQQKASKFLGNLGIVAGKPGEIPRPPLGLPQKGEKSSFSFSTAEGIHTFPFFEAVKYIRGCLSDQKENYTKTLAKIQHDKGWLKDQSAWGVHFWAQFFGRPVPPPANTWNDANTQLDQANGSMLLGDSRVAQLRLEQAVQNYNLYASCVKGHLDALISGAETGQLMVETTIQILSAAVTGAASAEVGVLAGAATSGIAAGTTEGTKQFGEWCFDCRTRIDLTTIVGNTLAAAVGSFAGGGLSKVFLPRLSVQWSGVWKMQGKGFGSFGGLVLLPEASRVARLSDYFCRVGGKYLEEAIKAFVAGTPEKIVTAEFLVKGLLLQMTKSSAQSGFAAWLAAGAH